MSARTVVVCRSPGCTEPVESGRWCAVHAARLGAIKAAFDDERKWKIRPAGRAAAARCAAVPAATCREERAAAGSAGGAAARAGNGVSGSEGAFRQRMITA